MAPFFMTPQIAYSSFHESICKNNLIFNWEYFAFLLIIPHIVMMC